MPGTTTGVTVYLVECRVRHGDPFLKPASRLSC